MSNRNDKTHAIAGGCMAGVAAAPKHSAPFYVSSSLFRNRRLKQKRLRWQQKLAHLLPHQYTYTRRSRTDGRVRKRLAERPADVTIDLLSDEDEDNGGADVDAYGQPTRYPTIALSEAQHLLLLPSSYQISDVPNITLMPVNKVSPIANGLCGPMARRKSLAPKRLQQATIVNNESIVLTDDDDETHAPTQTHMNHNNNYHNHRSDIESFIPSTRISNENYHGSAMKRQSTPKKATRTSTKASVTTTPQLSAHVDDEVTVSIVPRSSTAGTCKSKSSADESFPMLPDETTVHTVIANRTYELSLTKLREGLATYSPDDETEAGKQTPAMSTSNAKPRKRKNQVSPIKQQQQNTIALKLSSDLSISLISDDEDDGGDGVVGQHVNGDGAYKSKSSEELVSPLIINSSTDTRQVPRRRKLG